MKPIFGIDLGTTNSLIGLWSDGKVELAIDMNSPLIPSVVAFVERGDDSSYCLIGALAHKEKEKGNPYVLYGIKRFMGLNKKDVDASSNRWLKKSFYDFSLSQDEGGLQIQLPNRKLITPIEVSSLILQHVKKVAEKHFSLPVKDCVITVPAYFNEVQRKATKEAAVRAGLCPIRLVNEPTAASLAYGLSHKPKGVIAVYDFGGGTFDISILRLSSGIFEVIATYGDPFLGGEDMDEMYLEYLFETGVITNKNITEEDKRRLLTQVENIKKKFSSHEIIEYEFFSHEGKKTLYRKDFDTAISPLIQKTIDCVEECLDMCGMDVREITDVVLVGGSSRGLLVKKMVRDFFQTSPFDSLDPEKVVAHGAAIEGAILSGSMKDVILIDVLSHSLCLETIGGKVEKILERNSKIPMSTSHMFSTSVDGQKNILFHILQGESSEVVDNKSLFRFELRGIPPMPKGVPRIQVDFSIDASGLLYIKARELLSNEQTEIYMEKNQWTQ